jgi:hypothetical protein
VIGIPRKTVTGLIFIAQVARGAALLTAADDAFAFFAEEAQAIQQANTPQRQKKGSIVNTHDLLIPKNRATTCTYSTGKTLVSGCTPQQDPGPLNSSDGVPR